jgi:hypothetical protein
MSANTLTGLIPEIQIAANKVLREQIGFIPAVYMNAAAEQAAKDQVVQYPIVPTIALQDVAPAAVPTEPTGRTLTYGEMTISKVKKAPFHWGGEEQSSISGIYEDVKKQTFEQAFRALVNDIENDLFLAAKQNASRAYGTAGTTPFATANNLTDIAQIRKILTQNGAWTSDMHFVLSTDTGAQIRGIQSGLFKVNEAGDASLLREGRLGDLQGFKLHESGQIVSHTPGSGTGYLINLTAGYAAGSESFVLDTGSGTILAGDILTNTKTGRDTNKYVVDSALASNAVGLSKPGNKIAWVNNDPVAVGAAYTGNFAFERNALHLVSRLPKLPKEGALGEHEVITDPYSGLSFMVSMYAGYHEVIFEVSLAWGVKAVKQEAIATLLG